MDIQVSFEDFLAFPNPTPEVAIKPIPTIPITIAQPVLFSPKMFPSNIKKAPIKHNEIPNTNETYCQRIIITTFSNSI